MDCGQKITTAILAGLFVVSVNAQVSAALLDQCQKVGYPVGLIVRSAPASNSKRLGSIPFGKKVVLDGDITKDASKVDALTPRDSEGNAWIKIKAPVSGYVLYSTDGDPHSLLPCE